MRNAAARNLAIAKDAPAIVVNPSTAAIKPITRNVKAQPSMVTSTRLNCLIWRNAFQAFLTIQTPLRSACRNRGSSRVRWGRARVLLSETDFTLHLFSEGLERRKGRTGDNQPA